VSHRNQEDNVNDLFSFFAGRPALLAALSIVLAVLLAACKPGGSGGTGY
jgi:hypothetical protein